MADRLPEDCPAIKSREVLGWTDETLARYRKDLEGATNVTELQDALRRWPTLAPDALAACPQTDEEFRSFKLGMSKERAGHFAWEEFVKKFGAVLMPERMLEIAFLSARCNVPFGVAYIRGSTARTWKWEKEEVPK